MKLNLATGLIVATLAGSLLIPSIANAGPWVKNVNHRLARQHSRIKQGVHSGQLTRGERLRDKSADARIRARELTDQSKHNGHLTKGEHVRLERSLNKNSAGIWRTKHNKKVQ